MLISSSLPLLLLKMKLVIKAAAFACIFSNPFVLAAQQKHPIPSTYKSLQTKALSPPYFLSLPCKCANNMGHTTVSFMDFGVWKSWYLY